MAQIPMVGALSNINELCRKSPPPPRFTRNSVLRTSRFLLLQSANFWYSTVGKNHSGLAKLFMSIYHHDHPIKTPLSRYRFTKSIYLVYTKYILNLGVSYKGRKHNRVFNCPSGRRIKLKCRTLEKLCYVFYLYISHRGKVYT